MKHIKYPSIEQFRHVVSCVLRSYHYIRLNENNEPVYDLSIPKPILKFNGTVNKYKYMF